MGDARLGGPQVLGQGAEADGVHDADARLNPALDLEGGKTVSVV